MVKANKLKGEGNQRRVMMTYRILVVDDEQSIAEILKYSLEKEG